MPTIPNYTPVYNCFSNGYYEPWQSPEALYEPSTVIINDSWLRPRSALERCTMKTTSFSARRMEKRDNTYWVTERSGREVRGPKLTIQKKIIIDPKPDGKFAGIKVMLDFEDEKNIMCFIPYSAFIKRDVLPHLPQHRVGFDCPENYITAAFYMELFANEDFSFMHTPTHSGWEMIGENKAVFNSACNVDPQLASLYPADVCSRVMVSTQKNLADACEALAKILPSSWKYKFLLCSRITSLLLFFYGSTPDMLITIEAPDEDRLRSAMTLLWNKDRMPTALPVASSRSKIERELAGVTDGVVLFSDYSYAEDHRKREAGLGVIFDSLRDIHGHRCLPVLLTEQLGNVSAEAPVIPLNLIGCPRIDDYNVVGDALGELDSAIIKLLSRSPLDDNLVTGHVGKVDYIQSFPSDAKQYKLTEMFLISMEIMHSYGLVSDDDKDAIIKNCLRYRNFFEYDLNFQIVNDFKRVVSECLSIGSLKAISQYGQPYFTHEQNKVIVDSHFLNITRYALETAVIPKLRFTRKRKRLLQALRAAGKLYATNNNKRTIDVETEPGVFSTVNVYSVPLDILSSECTARLRTITHAGNLIRPDKAPAGFIPLISINGSDEAAGVVISDLTDEATSVYISGQTRTGKSCWLANQAVLRSRAGHKVVILDQAGSFTREELEKHLPASIVEESFRFWDVNRDGLPVDMLSISHCLSLPDKKNRLFSIFAEAAGISGEVQGKLLRKRLSDISKAIDAGTVCSLQDTLRFFDPNDPEQLKIRERLEEVFDDLEGLPTAEGRWDKFLGNESGILVISTSTDGIRKKATLVNMMLADLYEFKQHTRESRLDIILDEIEDLNLDHDGPISSILRKGAKHRLSMLLASQEYSVEKDRLGKLIGNCGTHIFFRPKDSNLDDLAKKTRFDKATLASLEQGQCVVSGLVYDQFKERNTHSTIAGSTFTCEP